MTRTKRSTKTTKRRRAPRGGRWCNGRFYRGGWFLPNDDRAKERQKAGGKQHGKGRPKVVENLPQPIHEKARDEAGKAVGVSGILTALTDQIIQHTLAVEFGPDPEAARAHRAVLRGSTARRDVEVLDRRRRAAVAMLADCGSDVLRPYWRSVLAALPAR